MKGTGKPAEILTKLNEMAGYSPDHEIELYEVCFHLCICIIYVIHAYSANHINEKAWAFYQILRPVLTLDILIMVTCLMGTLYFVDKHYVYGCAI